MESELMKAIFKDVFIWQNRYADKTFDDAMWESFLRDGDEVIAKYGKAGAQAGKLVGQMVYAIIKYKENAK